jgi:hypothetical protein
MTRRPPYSIAGALTKSVEFELMELLARARRGEIYGLAYVLVNQGGSTECGLAGNLGRDALRASGALHQAANATAETKSR